MTRNPHAWIYTDAPTSDWLSTWGPRGRVAQRIRREISADRDLTRTRAIAGRNTAEGMTSTETTTLRKRTVFEPCAHHAPMFATETRYRRAEVMVEGGYASSPCTEGTNCQMKPGTDFYCSTFVAENPVYRVA